MLLNEQQSRANYLAGDIRRYESDYKELLDQLDSERNHFKAMVLKNKSYLKTAKKLGEARSKLLDEIATLKDQMVMDKQEIKQLRQQAADNARSMRELKRELRKPILNAESRASEAEARAEAAQVSAQAEVERAVREMNETKKETMKDLRKVARAVHAAEWRVHRKECEVDLKVAKAQGEARRAQERANKIIALCDLDVENAMRDVHMAAAEAAAAREEAIAEAKMARDAEEAKTMAEYQAFLLRRQVERAQAKAAKLKETLKDLQPIASTRTEDDWAALEDSTRRKAAQRERDALRHFFSTHQWRAQDLATVLEEVDLLAELYFTKEGEHHFFQRVKELHSKLESADYGLRFGLVLHFEMRLTLAKIQQIVEAACKEFFPTLDRYKKKPWYSNPFQKREVLYTPRIVPSRSKLEPAIPL